jgi:hypothetical protein
MKTAVAPKKRKDIPVVFKKQPQPSLFFARAGERGQRHAEDVESETEAVETETEDEKGATRATMIRRRLAAARKRPQPESRLRKNGDELILESEDAKTRTQRWVAVDEVEGGLVFAKRPADLPNMEIRSTDTGMLKKFWLQGIVQDPMFVHRRGGQAAMHIVHADDSNVKIAWREGPLRGEKRFRSAYEGPAEKGRAYDQYRFGAYKFALESSRDLESSPCTQHGILQVGPSCMSTSVLNAFLVIEELRNAVTAHFVASAATAAGRKRRVGPRV